MTAVPDLAAWLRREIEADLAAARIIGAGGFMPERWDTDPPGQVNPDDIPASRQVTEAIGAAHEEVCGWVQLVAWNRLNNEPPEKDSRDSTSPVILVDNGRREFEHIIRQDPRNTVARCEAELAILGLHVPLEDTEPPMCVICLEHVDCRTVRLLGSGYRHRPGYDSSWAP